VGDDEVLQQRPRPRPPGGFGEGAADLPARFGQDAFKLREGGVRLVPVRAVREQRPQRRGVAREVLFEVFERVSGSPLVAELNEVVRKLETSAAPVRPEPASRRRRTR